MTTRQVRRTNTSTPSDGSRTITLREDQPREDDSSDSQSMGTLRLRGAVRRRQRVVWREDVVDNEGAGKKKSKSESPLPSLLSSASHARPLSCSHPLPAVCCIYHKPRQFDESSSSESSDSDSEPDSDAAARRRCNHDHDHDHDHNHDGADSGHNTASRNEEGGGVVHELESDEEDANAYERRPRRKPQETNCECAHLVLCLSWRSVLISARVRAF
ncbi:hypothetical protein GSI_02046 [Ganoderma sinense ZZ0214-1]|uniref:Type 1 phosphatases regulator n=1 Tax=Ganoderma sinense ZZ0214-1 TaxID=1077348 RepID=A0A2G8SNI4_9APHY|nr:hypothetical protein GSI_02046 [Ganoderma sinense ZZ0214-1]